MSTIEMTGKNIEEATLIALEQLGVTEDEVDVEILEEGAKGFLGLGQAPAKVRVTLKATPAPAPKTVRRKKEQPVEVKPVAKVEAPAPAKQAPAAPAPKLEAADKVSQDVLQHILDGIGMGGNAVLKQVSDDQVNLNIDGGDAAILIGKHGQTIDAIQYLVSVITNRRVEAKTRISIDAEGYRARREEALKQHALYLASKVKETGQEAVLDSLPANERRIVHTALAEDTGVYTYSEGVEPNRHMVISPKK